MPRRKVVERRRCLKACDSCNKRKDKCDGLAPCSQCVKRNVQDRCVYTPTTFAKAKSHKSPNNDQHHGEATIHIDDGVTAQLPSGTSNTVNDDTSFDGDNDSSPTTGAPAPRLARFLRDPKGKFIYIGDSASLSFLQSIRRVVNSSIGPCDFTTDGMRHRLIETAPAFQGAVDGHSAQSLDLQEAEELTTHYFLAVSGALDLFDSSAFLGSLSVWFHDPKRDTRHDCPLFYLVLAIGAQARVRTFQDDYAAEYYFSYGRQLAIANLMDNPSMLTVQVFAMIAWYMITACRRNGALMNLGIAIQAAYALGIHRHEANVAFERSEVICRERAWKTLRVCDLFLSASIGRPSTTSNINSKFPKISPASYGGPEVSESNARLSSAMTRICLIFEQILTKVYSNREISLEVAADISKQHREWTIALPEMLKVDGLASSDNQDSIEFISYLGSTIVVIAYYYSIILLTRPFLTFRVSSRIRREGPWSKGLEDAEPSAGVTTYSDACVTSAIKGIGLAYNLTLCEGLPKRMPLIINSVFISALSVGLAYFGDYDQHGWPLETAITQAINVLGHFGVHNPQSARYNQIIDLLFNAANQYKDRRDENLLHLRSKNVSEVFGHVANEAGPKTRPSPSVGDFASFAKLSSNSDGSGVDVQDDLGGPFPAMSQNFELLAEGSIITTSGKLAVEAMQEENVQYSQHFNMDADPDAFFGAMYPPASTNLSFSDELPLFSIVTDYHPGI